jgi:hypothetical protein
MLALRAVFSLVVLVCVSNVVSAQNNPPVPLQLKTPTAPTAPPEPAERQVRHTVIFITMHCLRGVQPVTAQGTGFFIHVADNRLPADSGFVYLVTNRHMALCWDDDRNPMQVQAVTLRVNMKDGSSQELTMTGNLPWILPKKDSVDLAIVPMALDPTKCDYLTIPESLFVTDDVAKKESVSEGIKIIFSGFFYQVPGLKHVQPIIREGVVAMMPDEDLVTTTGKMGRVYLGEVHAFHGNSGSPVFVDLGGLRGGSMRVGVDYKLLGIVSGGYGEGEQNALVLETPLASKPGNSGIAVIVPASELKALLDEPTAAVRREAEIARLAQEAKKGN